jgi:5S rRNA maturation endonuclease (ribonuclease M5)
MTKKTVPSKYDNQARLNALSKVVLENIDVIYDFFDVRFRRGQTLYSSCCFIHGGDNKTALNFYHDPYEGICGGHYKCRTHGCEQHFGNSLLSMVRGGLSHLKHGWRIPGDKQVTFDQTIGFLLAKLNIDYYALKTETLDTGNHEFCRVVNTLVTSRPSGSITRDFYRERIEIPSKYYLQRGYSIEVLDEYDVGTCNTYGKPMFHRSVVPIYDEFGETIIGFTGRSIFEKCEDCKSYHDPEKPCHNFPKWRHTKGLEKNKILYNYWKAKEHILSTNTIILVESPGNVWRLEEAGIHNAVAIFGTTLNPEQLALIDESGALNIILLMDNDDAGREAADRIRKQCERTYRVYSIAIKADDVAVMSTNEVTQDIKPLLDKIVGEVA